MQLTVETLRTFDLRLTEEEAEQLYALVGHVAGNSVCYALVHQFEELNVRFEPERVDWDEEEIRIA